MCEVHGADVRVHGADVHVHTVLTLACMVHGADCVRARRWCVPVQRGGCVVSDYSMSLVHAFWPKLY